MWLSMIAWECDVDHRCSRQTPLAPGDVGSAISDAPQRSHNGYTVVTRCRTHPKSVAGHGAAGYRVKMVQHGRYAKVHSTTALNSTCETAEGGWNQHISVHAGGRTCDYFVWM